MPRPNLSMIQKMLQDKDISTIPAPPSPIPIPYPNIGTVTKDTDKNLIKGFTTWVNGFNADIAARSRAAKKIDTILKDMVTFSLETGKAFSDVDKTLARIAQLQTSQVAILSNAKKLEVAIDKGFKHLDKLSKKGDSKAIESAKAVLIGQGHALTALVSTLQALNKQIIKEKTSLDRAISAVAAM